MVFGGELVGDNIEFTAVNIDDYTIYFNQTGTDTATEKYAQNNPTTARRFSLRADQTVEMVEQNGIELTNPITIILNKEYTERRDIPMLNQIKIRTATANTLIRIRWN